MTTVRKSRCEANPLRHGSAMLELAVCLPVISLIIFASLEGANLLFVRQAAVQAAYETVKSAVKPRGNADVARALGSQVLNSRNLTQHTISISPNVVDDAPRGTPVTVTVAINSNSRGITRVGPFQNLQITAEAVMVKE